MTYETFKETMIQELRLHFPGDTSITAVSIPRNNGTCKEGLTILESGFNIAPTLYLMEYYEDLKSGTPFVSVLSHLLEAYYEYRPKINIDPNFFRDFSNICDRIVFRLIHQKQNEDLLAEIPHVPYLDLAIVFCCLLRSDEEGHASILIRNSHLELWQTNTESLLALAQVNTPFLLSPTCDEISELLIPLVPEEEQKELKEMQEQPPMYVLTNESRMYGATCILYQDLLRDIADRFAQDFYILPSSVHEVILVPAEEEYLEASFNSMIRDVNSSQLTREEILSDHLYYYSRLEDKVS